MHGEANLTCSKKVKRQHRTIILAILVDLLSPVICATRALQAGHYIPMASNKM